MGSRQIELDGLKINRCLQINRLYTLFTKDMSGNFFYEGEQHDFWELVICTGGQLGITAGKYIFNLGAGECFFHKPMEFHNVWTENSANAQMRIVTFSCGNVLNVRHMPYVLSEVQMESIEKLFQEAGNTFSFFGGNVTGITANDICKCQKFVNSMENLLIDIISGNELADSVVNSRNAKRYLNAVETMEEHWNERLTVGKIAELCGLGEANLKKIFKKYAGIGVMEYYAKLKIEKAKQLLLNENSVRYTAQMLGFEDQNYFSVFFKKQTGISPSRYLTEML